jgi:hypothetical protein
LPIDIVISVVLILVFWMPCDRFGEEAGGVPITESGDDMRSADYLGRIKESKCSGIKESMKPRLSSHLAFQPDL